MRNHNRYTVVVIPDEEDGRFLAVPAIPICFTHGKTAEHAIAIAEDAAAPLLASFAAHDEEIPVQAPGAVVATIEVPVPAGGAV